LTLKEGGRTRKRKMKTRGGEETGRKKKTNYEKTTLATGTPATELYREKQEKSRKVLTLADK